MTIGLILAAVAIGAWPGAAVGRNVDLSTVPRRDTVQLTIYNSEDLTLVRETRTVTFKKGVNPLQFSWANTLIDPTSVHLRFLTSADQLDLLDTTFPHDKPQMLYWNVQSERDGEATIEITYFTSGISWSADYICITDPNEKAMRIDNFVRVYNNSGEEYEDAQVRLVVGTINLVEKIARLGKEGLGLDPAAPPAELHKAMTKLKEKVLADELRPPANGPESDAKLNEKGVVKEGLSEYFIYTIEGTESIRNGWSKRMRSLNAADVPLKIQYRYRPDEYGDQLVRMFLLINDKPSRLGTTPLPDGTVRLFRENGRGGLSFLVEQPIKYIPIGDKIELNLGPDRNVIFELVKLNAWRDEIWMQVGGRNIFRRVDGPGLQIEVNSSVVGWAEHELYSQRVRNYTAKAIEVEVRRTWPGDITFKSALSPTLYDYRTPQFTATVEAGKKAELMFEIIRKQGRNARQERVILEKE